MKFAKKHRLKICTIADLIQFRRTREKLVEHMEVVKMPTDYGEFDLASLSLETRWAASSRAWSRRRRWQKERARPRAQRMPHGRCVRLAPL